MESLLNIALFPGVILHEAGHALGCYVVGVKIHRFIPIDLSQDLFSQDWGFFGRVHHAPADTGWQSQIILLAPFAVNTIAAFAAFSLAELVLFGTFRFSELAPVGESSGHIVSNPDQLIVVIEWFRAVGSSSLFEQVVVGSGLWLGIAFSVSAVPSPTDSQSAVKAAKREEGLLQAVLLIVGALAVFMGSDNTGVYLLYPVVIFCLVAGGISLMLNMWPLYLYIIGIAFVVYYAPKSFRWLRKS